MQIRPTADKVKEALFNIIQAIVADATVLDLYAGTGALGIEALSRGAQKAIFIDSFRDAISVIETNVKNFELTKNAKIYNATALEAIKRFGREGVKFDIIFLDPPYEAYDKNVLKEIEVNAILSDKGIVVLEHDAEVEVDETIDNLKRFYFKKYGRNALSFYR